MAVIAFIGYLLLLLVSIIVEGKMWATHALNFTHSMNATYAMNATHALNARKQA